MAAMSDTGSSLAQWAELYHDASAAHGGVVPGGLGRTTPFWT